MDGVWRDERRLTLAALYDAVGVYSTDGQVDDPTGGDAGAESAYGEELRADPDPDQPDPDPDSAEGRRLRPGPDGRIGPA